MVAIVMQYIRNTAYNLYIITFISSKNMIQQNIQIDIHFLLQIILFLQKRT